MSSLINVVINRKLSETTNKVTQGIFTKRFGVVLGHLFYQIVFCSDFSFKISSKITFVIFRAPKHLQFYVLK